MADKVNGKSSGSRYKNQERWRAHVLAQQRGNLTQRAYCQAHELTYSSFTRWRRILLGRDKDQRPSDETGGFVPVVVEPKAVSVDADRGASVTMVLPNGIRIEGITRASAPAAVALVTAL